MQDGAPACAGRDDRNRGFRPEDDMADQQIHAVTAAPSALTALGRSVLVLLAACLLAACVQSKAPLLTGTKPVLGEEFQLNLFEDFTEGKALSAKISVFRWNGARYAGARYAYVSGNSSDVKSLVAEPLDADTFLIEASDDKVYAYLLGRKLTEGTYRISPVDEKNLDKAAQTRICVAQNSETCTVATRPQLDTFVRASIGKTIPYTMVVVISRT
jgi:hypothetical protein